VNDLPVKKRKAIGVVEAQDEAKSRAAVESYCRGRGYEVVEVHVGIEEAKGAIERACVMKAALVAATLGSVARSMPEVARLGARLAAAGADLAVVDRKIDTADRDEAQRGVVFRLLDAMADLEYHRMADRLPYGYTVSDDLEHVIVDERETAVIRRMIHLYRDGSTAADIARGLNEEKVATRKGGAWTGEDVQKVIDHAPTSRWEFSPEQAD